MESDKKIYLIILEGLICSGKSTVTRNLKQHETIKNYKNVHFIDEPIEEYTHYQSQVDGFIYNPLKELYISTSSKNTACTQLIIMDALIKRFEKAIAEKDILAEPCIFICDRYFMSVLPFLETHREYNHLTEFSYSFLKDRLYDKTLELGLNTQITVAKHYFLNTSLEECIDRIYKRVGEENQWPRQYMTDYLKSLKQNTLNTFTGLKILENDNLNDIIKIIVNDINEIMVQYS